MNNGLKPWHKILIVLIVLYFIYAFYWANRMAKMMERKSTLEPLRVRMAEGDGRNN